LKNIEHLYLQKRDGQVVTAGDSMVYYYRWLTHRDGEHWQSSSTLRLIREYNHADCDSTWLLAEWLRQRQSEAGQSYVGPEPPPELAAETTGRAALAQEMLAQIPVDRTKEPERWRVHELLAHLLEFQRREQKSLHWARFERLAMTEQELLEDPECLGEVERTATPPIPVKLSFLYEYRFPDQESKLRGGSACELSVGTKLKATIESIDYDRQLLTIKRGKRSGALPDRFSLIPDEIFNERVIVESIERTVRRYLATGEPPAALQDFLFRQRPRIHESISGPPIQQNEDVLVGAKRVVLGLNRSALCIQGPPGSGKTSKGGQVIAELLKAGKRVGISSNTHDAICELMKSASEAATQEGIHFTAAKCGEEDRVPFHPAIEIVPDNAAIFKRETLPDLVGGTAWVFSRPEAEGQFDYLFIDEAGQVSLAKLVGMASSASNLILLGDQMQLGQPIRGVHPGESGASILEYYLESHATIPEDRGIFLPKTWRMRPEICSFISKAIYDGRLGHELVTETRSIHFTKPSKYLYRSTGLVYVAVDHEGNAYESEEEVRAVEQIVRELIGQTLEQPGHPSRLISKDDILVVAPFNLQVRKLKIALPGIRVGTVDKFQGQQAPVVIFSMTASDGDASPRGMEFLFDKHRLNVAISRAQILAVLVASRKLERTRCTKLEHIPLINMFCRAAYEGSQWLTQAEPGMHIA
ncbi:MAG: DEAD/DEAH box helicase, partial [Ktedonobacteraceae bacterium]